MKKKAPVKQKKSRKWLLPLLAACVVLAAGAIILTVILTRPRRTLLITEVSPYGDGTMEIFQSGAPKGNAYRLIVRIDGRDMIAYTVTTAENAALSLPQISWLYGAQVIVSGNGDGDFYRIMLAPDGGRTVVEWSATYRDYSTASLPDAYQVKSLRSDVVLARLPETAS